MNDGRFNRCNDVFVLLVFVQLENVSTNVTGARLVLAEERIPDFRGLTGLQIDGELRLCLFVLCLFFLRDKRKSDTGLIGSVSL